MRTHKARGRPPFRGQARGLEDLHRTYRRTNPGAAEDAPINFLFPPHAYGLSRDISPLTPRDLCIRTKPPTDLCPATPPRAWMPDSIPCINPRAGGTHTPTCWHWRFSRELLYKMHQMSALLRAARQILCFQAFSSYVPLRIRRPRWPPWSSDSLLVAFLPAPAPCRLKPPVQGAAVPGGTTRVDSMAMSRDIRRTHGSQNFGCPRTGAPRRRTLTWLKKMLRTVCGKAIAADASYHPRPSVLSMAMEIGRYEESSVQCDPPEVIHGSPTGNGPSARQDNHRPVDLWVQDYWKFIYRILCERGYSRDQAKDLTQSFFADIFLRQPKLMEEAVGRTNPRFRGLLLVILGRYLIRIRRREMAMKRMPQSKSIRVEIHFHSASAHTRAPATPDDLLDYARVSGILQQTLRDVEVECHKNGKSLYWRLFSERVLIPLQCRDPAPSLEELCRKHGIEDVRTASNMIVTIRRTLQKALIQHLRTAAGSDEEALDELREIRRIVSRVSHGSP